MTMRRRPTTEDPLSLALAHVLVPCLEAWIPPCCFYTQFAALLHPESGWRQEHDGIGGTIQDTMGTTLRWAKREQPFRT